MSNSNVIGPSSGTSTARQIQIGLADRGQFLLFADLRHAVHQQIAFHLVGHFLAEPVLDQLPRCAAGTKTRHLALGHQFAEGLVEIPFDVFVRNFDGDVPLAGAGAWRWSLPDSAACASSASSVSGASLISVSAMFTGKWCVVGSCRTRKPVALNFKAKLYLTMN